MSRVPLFGEKDDEPPPSAGLSSGPPALLIVFDIPTPFLRERNILTRSSAIVMASGVIGSATEDLRSASIFSLSVPQPVTHHTVSLPDLPSSSPDELDIRGDLHKRRIEWGK